MIVIKSEISSETALRLVQGAVAYDERNSWKICSAVTDLQGAVCAFLRMDSVAAPTAEFALDKAYTAATMRRSTEAFFHRMNSNPSL